MKLGITFTDATGTDVANALDGLNNIEYMQGMTDGVHHVVVSSDIEIGVMQGRGYQGIELPDDANIVSYANDVDPIEPLQIATVQADTLETTSAVA